MIHLPAMTLLFAFAVVAGCSTHPAPENRPYSVEEQLELSLESLNRRGLSFDEYQREKTRVLRSQPASYGFEGMGAVNAARTAASKDREG